MILHDKIALTNYVDDGVPPVGTDRVQFHQLFSASIVSIDFMICKNVSTEPSSADRVSAQ